MLKFGWSQKSIAIDGPVGIIGQPHLRISHGIMDENFVTALVIDDGKETVLMLSGDLIFVDDGLIYEVRKEIRARNPKIPAERLLFNATHNHTSPRYERHTDYDLAPHEGITMTDPEVCRRYIVSQAADAVTEAYAKRQEGSYAYGYGYAVIAHHRRPTYFDDLRSRPEKTSTAFAVNKHAKMYGSTRDIAFAGYEGGVDHTVNLLFTFDRAGTLTGMIVNVPCPSQCSEQAEYLTADFWTELRTLVKETYGDVFVLPQCACAGDVAPRALHGWDAETRRRHLKNTEGLSAVTFSRTEIARQILAAINECYAWARSELITDAPLFHTVRTLHLDAWQVSDEEYRAIKEERDELLAHGFVDTVNKQADFRENTRRAWMIGRCNAIIEVYEKKRTHREAEIHLIRLGDVAFASNPFEAYTDYQHRIQARSPFIQLFPVQLAAQIDADGYLCTARAAENMGYSAVVQSCSVSPAGGNVLVEETLRELNKLYQK